MNGVEATCSEIGTSTAETLLKLLLLTGVGAGVKVKERMCTGDARKVARERVLSIKFYGSSLSRQACVYGTSGMSNGCRGIACRFTHQANFPAYRGAIFLPPSLLFPSGASSLCSYFTFSSADSSSRFRFPSHHCATPSRPDKSALSCPNLSSVV